MGTGTTAGAQSWSGGAGAAASKPRLWPPVLRVTRAASPLPPALAMVLPTPTPPCAEEPPPRPQPVPKAALTPGSPRSPGDPRGGVGRGRGQQTHRSSHPCPGGLSSVTVMLAWVTTLSRGQGHPCSTCSAGASSAAWGPGTRAQGHGELWVCPLLPSLPSRDIPSVGQALGAAPQAMGQGGGSAG